MDGLDEDEGAGMPGRSIAAVLPKNPPRGMRVLVTGRSNPALSADVDADHPLRDSNHVRVLAVSSEALIIRDAAMQELSRLLDDPLGSDLLGLLSAARGGLGLDDLAELTGASPYKVEKLVRGVTGRSMAPQSAGPPTYVLAHEGLLQEALKALGKSEVTRYEQRLHDWADAHHVMDWPADTPSYLLTHYTWLLRHNSDTTRLTKYVLAPKRQLRLAAESGADLALAELRLLLESVSPEGTEGAEGYSGGQDRPGGTATPKALAVAAAVAVSREFLLSHARAVPRDLLRAFARIGDTGDVRRARALALLAPHPSARALRLSDISRNLANKEEALALAREAAVWASEGRWHIPPLPPEDEEADVDTALAESAGALLRAGAHNEGLDLLRSVEARSAACFTAVAAAAADLLQIDGQEDAAAAVLDGLKEQAEFLASDMVGHGAVAIEVWGALVKVVTPKEATKIFDRMEEECREVWACSPELTVVDTLALAATALAGRRRTHARDFADLTVERLLAAFRAPESLSAEDHAHMALGLATSLARVVQALIDTGDRRSEAAELLEAVPEDLRTRFSGYDVRDAARAVLGERRSADPGDASLGPGPDPGPDPVLDVERLIIEARHLSEHGNAPEARQRLDEVLRLLALPGSGTEPAVRWLPALAGALAGSGKYAEAEQLAPWMPDDNGRARLHAASSMACAASVDRTKALEFARRADHTTRNSDTHPATRAVIAQALAHAGDATRAMELAEQMEPTGGLRRGQVRQQTRHALVAVSAGLAAYAPDAANRIVEDRLAKLAAHADLPGARARRLPELAELLLGVKDMEQPCYEPLRTAIRTTCGRDDVHPAEREYGTVAVHVLLGLAARGAPAPDVRAEVKWLEGKVRNSPPHVAPADQLAVLYALMGDVDAARRTAARPRSTALRAAAYSAVAGQLAGIRDYLSTSCDSSSTEPAIHRLRALALALVPAAPRDAEAARGFVWQALAEDGWHHALPLLAQLAPEAVTRVGDITRVHLGSHSPQ
ncbi:hypothetical protein [Streptomyces paludis]|uniref:Uncharacterized protein n=1 Tax=Streptomyces paludis TaxID=2282738 RepID=A0A345HPN5_9ACTN|nr:hypothetical protein [Streptomyces paludis]AXG78659.1 hypothetical protein DVK44_14125 [Streptomyces paludis]